MSASPLRVPRASGTANGGSGCPVATPRDPLGVVLMVLTVISAMTRSATTPTNQPYREPRGPGTPGSGARAGGAGGGSGGLMPGAAAQTDPGGAVGQPAQGQPQELAAL